MSCLGTSVAVLRLRPCPTSLICPHAAGQLRAAEGSYKGNARPPQTKQLLQRNALCLRSLEAFLNNGGEHVPESDLGLQERDARGLYYEGTSGGGSCTEMRSNGQSGEAGADGAESGSLGRGSSKDENDRRRGQRRPWPTGADQSSLFDEAGADVDVGNSATMVGNLVEPSMVRGTASPSPDPRQTPPQSRAVDVDRDTPATRTRDVVPTPQPASGSAAPVRCSPSPPATSGPHSAAGPDTFVSAMSAVRAGHRDTPPVARIFGRAPQPKLAPNTPAWEQNPTTPGRVVKNGAGWAQTAVEPLKMRANVGAGVGEAPVYGVTPPGSVHVSGSPPPVTVARSPVPSQPAGYYSPSLPPREHGGRHANAGEGGEQQEEAQQCRPSSLERAGAGVGHKPRSSCLKEPVPSRRPTM